MRKLFLILAVLLFVSTNVTLAQDSKELETFKTNVFRFLEKEGYIPKMDKDNDIVFKQAGETTFVMVYEPETEGYYIQIYRQYLYGDASYANLAKMKANINAVNATNRVVKSTYNDETQTITISAEFWANNSADFARLLGLFVYGITDARSEITKF